MRLTEVPAYFNCRPILYQGLNPEINLYTPFGPAHCQRISARAGSGPYDVSSSAASARNRPPTTKSIFSATSGCSMQYA